MTRLKPCAGCARAILETATACDYCGHKVADPIDLALASCDDVLDNGVPPLDVTLQGCVSEGSTSAKPAIEASTPKKATPGIPAPVASAPAAGVPEKTAFAKSAFANSGLRPATSQAATPPHAAPAPAAVVAGAKAPAASRNRRQLTIVLAGALGCVVVIIAALGARGSASPEPKAAPAAAAAAAPRKAPSAPAKTAPQAAPAAAAVTLPPNTPKWSSANRAFWVGNDRRAVAFELNAINKVQVWMRTVQPMLVVRCMAKKTEVFVYTSSPAKMEPQDEDHTVRISFDNEPLSTDRWPDSADHDGLFSPDPVAFTQRLMASRLLRFGFTPHNAEPVLAQFDVTGLGDLITPVAKQCGWSK